MIRFGLRLACFVALLFTCAASAQTQAAATPYQYMRIGNPADANVTPRPGYALMGGGKDLDEAFRWLCDRGNRGDFLVLRATGNDAYNPYLKHICKLNSIATLVIPTREAAADPFVAKAIAHASVLFIAGGDQANYINFWMNTPVQTAINDAIKRGVPIGGTSAGLAVMGRAAYTAQGDKPDDNDLDSKSTLADPFNPRVTLVRGFLTIPTLASVITDSHFAKRDRLGRLLVFLARINEPDGNPPPPRAPRINGLGIEERAAVLLEPYGEGTVIGDGAAYFVNAQKAHGAVEKGKPLTFGEFTVLKVAPGHTFNVVTGRGNATIYKLSIDAGAIRSSQKDGVIY